VSVSWVLYCPMMPVLALGSIGIRASFAVKKGRSKPPANRRPPRDFKDSSGRKIQGA
jgi:hypothetical protein